MDRSLLENITSSSIEQMARLEKDASGATYCLFQVFPESGHQIVRQMSCCELNRNDRTCDQIIQKNRSIMLGSLEITVMGCRCGGVWRAEPAKHHLDHGKSQKALC